MQFVVKVATLEVDADTYKEALADLAKKINKISNYDFFDTSKEFTFSVQWHKQAPTYRATITVYYKFDNAEIEQRHCQCCQEAHSLFYCNKNYNCNRCEYKAYMVRAEERAKLMKQAGREKLKDNKKNR